MLGNRIVLVIVTLSACHRQPEKHCARGVNTIDNGLPAELLPIVAAFLVNKRVAMKSRSDALRLGGIWQKVAGQLLDREFVEWHVGIECRNDPVAIQPNRPRPVD